MRFLPREEKFFQYFIDQAQLINEAASILAETCRNGARGASEAADRVSKIEQKGDEIIHAVFKKLNQTFITPIDPEDIHSLSSHLDDVLDYLEDAAHYIVVYKIDPIPTAIVEIANRIEGCAAALVKAFEALNENKPLIDLCIEINRLEGEVDEIERRAVADLFETESNPILVMKLREIYDVMEQTTDACEDVADLLQNVVVKNG